MTLSKVRTTNGAVFALGVLTGLLMPIVMRLILAAFGVDFHLL